ncbi:MAG: hypothetical protein BECKG1743F_GA0114225_110922 [Candidatus Kentron sp. G]|nr:MAG: hypothetical protein BECKG1743F_GA0114225_110922 [Candidatus Kentron sp. G]
MRKKLLDTFGAQVSSDHERYPADVKCLGFLYLYVGRYPRNNASRNTLGICTGQDAHFAGKRDLVTIPMHQCRLAWKIK